MSRKEEQSVRICPRCNSIKVFIDSSNPLTGAEGLPANYVCKDCGYFGKFFPEIEVSKLKNIKRKKVLKIKTENIDLSYGKFITHYWWRITGPLALIISIVMLLIAFQPKICETHWVNDTTTFPGSILEKQVTICSPDKTKLFDLMPFVSGLCLLAVSIFLIYMSYFRKIKEK